MESIIYHVLIKNMSSLFSLENALHLAVVQQNDLKTTNDPSNQKMTKVKAMTMNSMKLNVVSNDENKRKVFFAVIMSESFFLGGLVDNTFLKVQENDI